MGFISRSKKAARANLAKMQEARRQRNLRESSNSESGFKMAPIKKCVLVRRRNMAKMRAAQLLKKQREKEAYLSGETAAVEAHSSQVNFGSRKLETDVNIKTEPAECPDIEWNSDSQDFGNCAEEDAQQDPCFICQKIQYGSSLGYSISVFPGASVSSGCENQQLWSMFLLRQLLVFPEEECQMIVEKTSETLNPWSWYSLCEECSTIVEDAVGVHQRILRLELEMKGFREQIRGRLYESLKGMRDMSVSTAQQIRKSFQSLILSNKTRRKTARPVQDSLWSIETEDSTNQMVTRKRKLESTITEPLKKAVKTKNKKVGTDDIQIGSENSMLDVRKGSNKENQRELAKKDDLITVRNEVFQSHFKWYWSCADLEKEKEDKNKLDKKVMSVPTKVKKTRKIIPKVEVSKPSIPKPDGRSIFARRSEPLNSRSRRKHLQRIKCKSCNFVATNAQTLDRHMKYHKINACIDTTQPSGKHKCKLCNKTIENPQKVRSHVLNFHGKEIGITVAQKKEEDSFKCDKCDFVTTKAIKLDSHIRKHNMEKVLGDTADGKTLCKLCNKTFSKETVRKHIIYFHAKEAGFKDVFTCHLCQRGFLKADLLTDHIERIHYKQYRFCCDVCGKGLATRTGMKLHQAMHLNKGKNTVVCELCGLDFSGEKGLLKHMKRFHSESKKIEKSYSSEVASSNERGEEFPSSSSSLQQSEISRNNSDNPPAIQCKHCEVQIGNRRAFKLHMKSVHADLYTHKCDSCEASYMSRHNLNIHKEAAHSGKKAKCQYCDAEFTSYVSIYEHIKKSCRKYSGSKYSIALNKTATASEHATSVDIQQEGGNINVTGEMMTATSEPSEPEVNADTSLSFITL